MIGSESGVKSTIDTSLGGAAITTAPGYTKPPTDAIASAYMQPEALLKSVHGSSGATSQGITLLGQLFAGSQSASLSVTPTANSISLQGEVHSASGSTPLFGQEGRKALGELPGGAWLAAGVGNAGGANLPRALALLHGVSSFATSTVFASLGGPSIEKALSQHSTRQAQTATGLRQLGGPGGMFVSGTGLFNLQSALVIASSDPSASRAAVGKLGKLMQGAGAVVRGATIPGTDAAVSVKLQGFPAVIFIASGQNKFVLGLDRHPSKALLLPRARSRPHLLLHRHPDAGRRHRTKPDRRIPDPARLHRRGRVDPEPGRVEPRALLQIAWHAYRRGHEPGRCRAFPGGDWARVRHGQARHRSGWHPAERCPLGPLAPAEGRFSVSMMTRHGRLASR